MGTHVIAPIQAKYDKPYAVAITNSGRFAVVTLVAEDGPGFYTQDLASNAYVDKFMAHPTSAVDYLNEVAAYETRAGTARQGFNILVGDGVNVAYWSSRVKMAPTVLVPGVYVLSNALLGTPWPKCEWLRGLFAKKSSDFVTGTFASKDRALAAASVPAADVIPSARRENYEMCEAMLYVMCDRTPPLVCPRFHAVPGPAIAPFVSSVFLSPVHLAPRLLYGTHTTVVIIIPPYGECLYAQRSLSAPVHDAAAVWEEKAYCRKDVVFHRLEDAPYTAPPEAPLPPAGSAAAPAGGPQQAQAQAQAQQAAQQAQYAAAARDASVSL